MSFTAERSKGIGGSDIPILILGNHFGRTVHDLWLDKIGQGSSVAPSPSMQRGTRLEPVAIEEFSEATHRQVVASKDQLFFRHKERPYLLGHIDGKIVENGNWSGVLEVKIPGIKTYLEYKRNGIAEYIICQLQYYLGVTDMDSGSAWIWNPELWQGFTVDVKADPDFIEMMFDKADEFWGYVERKEEPPRQNSNEVLPVEMPKVKGEVLRVENDLWKEAAQTLRMAHELKEEAERIYDESKSRILSLMGDATAAEGHGVRVYHQMQKGRMSFDKALAMREVNRLREMCGIEKVDENWFMKQGTSYKVFRPYYLKQNLIEY